MTDENSSEETESAMEGEEEEEENNEDYSETQQCDKNDNDNALGLDSEQKVFNCKECKRVFLYKKEYEAHVAEYNTK